MQIIGFKWKRLEGFNNITFTARTIFSKENLTGHKMVQFLYEAQENKYI